MNREGRGFVGPLVGLALIGASATPLLAQGGIVHVPMEQPTIQAAIDAASPGDLILVAPGLYPETLDFHGKAVTVESEAGPESTVIDGRQAPSVVLFVTGEGRDSVLQGFTIRNGYAISGPPSWGRGGGIYTWRSSPTIRNNIITDNRSCIGCGIGVELGSPLIENNIITRNSQTGCTGATNGGGISLGGGSAEVIGNLVSENVTYGGGGGIGMEGDTPEIRNNVIRNNEADSGGGVWILRGGSVVGNLIAGNRAYEGGGVSWFVLSGSAAAPRLVGNTIVANDAPDGSGVFGGGFDAQAEVVDNLIVARPGQPAFFCGGYGDPAPPLLRSNDVFSLGRRAYSQGCPDPTGTDGNLSVDPAFRCPTGGDYHLTPLSAAVDAANGSVPGLPGTDLDGGPRALDGNADGLAAMDIGALEFDPSAPGTACDYMICPADIFQAAAPGQSMAVVDYALPVATPGSAISCAPPPGSGFPEGSTSVSCEAVHPSGGSSSCGFLVKVPPLNDDFDAAVRILSLPFEDRRDTRNATIAEDDPYCEARPPSVWYSFTPAQDTTILASVVGSRNNANISAYTGTRGSLSQIACGINRVEFRALAGQEIHLLVGSYLAEGEILDVLVVSLPPLAVRVDVNPVDRVVPSRGVATVGGTIACSRNLTVTLAVGLVQDRGLSEVVGGQVLDSPCEGPTPWTMRIVPLEGRFTAGHATVYFYAYLRDPLSGEEVEADGEDPVLLKGAAPVTGAPPTEPARGRALSDDRAQSSR